MHNTWLKKKKKKTFKLKTGISINCIAEKENGIVS